MTSVPPTPEETTPKQADKKQSAWAQVAKYSTIGLVIPSHLVAGWLLGSILDRVFHTTFLNIVFLITGIISGFVEMIRLASRNSD